MAYRQSDPQRRNDVVRYDLMERIGVLSTRDNGWTREVNIVSWNNGAAKVDIREWDPDHKRMTKGVTLFEEEAETLTKLLAVRYGLRMTEPGCAPGAAAGGESGRSFSADDHSPGSTAGGLSDRVFASTSEETEGPRGEESSLSGPASETEETLTAADGSEDETAGQCSSESDPAVEEAACAEGTSLYMN